MSNNAGSLFIVATPIGNLGDISFRAKEVLGSVDQVLCEDTRVTARLMAALAIRPSLQSFHEHTDALKRRAIVDSLLSGQSLALVTDAGTPTISDPGGALVADCVAAGIKVVPIPGACAVITALSVSGFLFDRFTFVGFPPHKKGRETFFRELEQLDQVIVLYESPHRIEKALTSLAALNRPLVVCRELTKLHETIYRGSAPEVLQQLNQTSSRGEFVIVVGQATT